MFMAGEHPDAISRVDNLIATIPLNSTCYVVQARAHALPCSEYYHSHFQQAYMYLLLGNSHMGRSNYESAIQSFGRARAQMRCYGGGPLLVLSLVSPLVAVLQRIEIAHRLCQISGWNFDNLHVTIRQRLCEALHAAGRTKDASESLLKLVNTLDEDVYMSGPITEWISG